MSLKDNYDLNCILYWTHLAIWIPYIMEGKRFFGAETSIFVWEVYIFCLKCGQIFASKLTFCVCFTIHIQSEWAWEDHDVGRRTPHRNYVVVILKKANFQLFCLLPVTLIDIKNVHQLYATEQRENIRVKCGVRPV